MIFGAGWRARRNESATTVFVAFTSDTKSAVAIQDAVIFPTDDEGEGDQ
jgi:hypothetical protein